MNELDKVIDVINNPNNRLCHMNTLLNYVRRAADKHPDSRTTLYNAYRAVYRKAMFHSFLS